MCLADQEKAFYRVPRRLLELALRKKGTTKALVRSVMSLYEGAKTRVRVDYELSEEIEVNVGIHRGSVLSHFLIALVVDVVTEFASEGVLSELMHADNIVLTCVTTEGLRNIFLKWKEAHENERLKANLWKTKITSAAALQRMACLKLKWTHVGTAV